LYRKLVDSNSTEWTKIRRLKDLQLSLNQSLEQCGKHVDALLHKEPYTRSEILKALNTTDEELGRFSLNANTQESKYYY
jgi:hypothetical protein